MGGTGKGALAPISVENITGIPWGEQKICKRNTSGIVAEREDVSANTRSVRQNTTCLLSTLRPNAQDGQEGAQQEQDGYGPWGSGSWGKPR